VIDATTLLTAMEQAPRVRVKIGDRELASIAAVGVAPWVGIVAGVQTTNGATEYGRTDAGTFTVYVPLASVTGGMVPDNGRVSIMRAGERVFTDYRCTGSQRRSNLLLSMTLGPLNG